MQLVFVIILFLIAAVFGLVLLNAILRNKRTSRFAIVAHGSFVTIALLVLIAYIATGHASPLLLTSLGLFILAALGGLTLLTLDASKKPPPKLIAIIHPLVAISALVILIIAALKKFALL